MRKRWREENTHTDEGSRSFFYFDADDSNESFFFFVSIAYMDVRRSILRRGIMFVEKESVWPCAGEKHDSLDKWFKYVVEEDTTFDVDHRFNLNRMSLFDVTVNGITNTIFLFSFFSLFKKNWKLCMWSPHRFPDSSLSLSFTLGVGLLSPGVGTWMIVMETRVNSRFQNKSFRLYWLQKKKNFFVSMVTHIQVHVHRRKVYPISSHPLLSRNTWKLKRTKKIFLFFPHLENFFSWKKSLRESRDVP